MRQLWASSRIARVGLIGLVLAGANVGASVVLAPSVAAGHVQMHATIAAFCLGAALALVGRWRTAGLAVTAPALGLFAVAVAQLTESLGAFGFGPDNNSRVNGLVVFHDLGLAVSAIGLVSLIVGVSFGVGLAFWRIGGAGRWIGAGAGGAMLIGGLVAAKTLIGF